MTAMATSTSTSRSVAMVSRGTFKTSRTSAFPSCVPRAANKQLDKQPAHLQLASALGHGIGPEFTTFGVYRVWSLSRFAFVFFWLGQFIPFGSLPRLGICQFYSRSLPRLEFTTFYHRQMLSAPTFSPKKWLLVLRARPGSKRTLARDARHWSAYLSLGGGELSEGTRECDSLIALDYVLRKGTPSNW